MRTITHAGFYKGSGKIIPLCPTVKVGDYYEYVERAQIGNGLPATVNCPHCIALDAQAVAPKES